MFTETSWTIQVYANKALKKKEIREKESDFVGEQITLRNLGIIHVLSKCFKIRIANLAYCQDDLCLSLDYTEGVLQYLR